MTLDMLDRPKAVATTMVALAKLEPTIGVWRTEAPIPSPGSGEVLIRVHPTTQQPRDDKLHPEAQRGRTKVDAMGFYVFIVKPKTVGVG